MPQDCDPDQLMTDKECLFNYSGTMDFQVVHNREGCLSTSWTGRFRCDSHGIDEGLRMRSPDVRKEVLDVLVYVLARRLDTSNDLYSEL